MIITNLCLNYFNILFLIGYNYSIDSNFFLLFSALIIIFLLIIYIMERIKIPYNNGNNSLPEYEDFPEIDPKDKDSWFEKIKKIYDEHKVAIIISSFVIIIFVAVLVGVPPPSDVPPANVEEFDVNWTRRYSGYNILREDRECSVRAYLEREDRNY